MTFDENCPEFELSSIFWILVRAQILSLIISKMRVLQVLIVLIVIAAEDAGACTAPNQPSSLTFTCTERLCASIFKGFYFGTGKHSNDPLLSSLSSPRHPFLYICTRASL